MSSKSIGQQQHGRRTPLSLGAGKTNHNQQQNQSSSNKANHNSNNHSSKSQEVKDATTYKNNNQAGKNQKDSIAKNSQKDNKKNQQNGNKDKISDDNSDCVVIIEENGTTNGNNNINNGGNPNRNSGNSAKITNQAVTKDNTTDINKGTEQLETGKEKQDEKSKKGDGGAKAVEKKQNDVVEHSINTSPLTNATKSKDDPSTPTSKSHMVNNVQEKIQEKPSTPTATEKSEKSTETPTKTPSKSPKAAVQPAEVTTEETNEVDMEPLLVESSPAKKTIERRGLAPAATSTPGKALFENRDNNAKSEIQVNTGTDRISFDRKSVPRAYSDISGRRSIRRSGDFTPNTYNSQFRESYRRINTELDVTGHTNTSMDVTVGSEIPNNSSFLSFSLFGRGRKRERTPPTVPGKSQSTVELTMETTPPKRARLDVHGIFSVMSSPLTMLRTRFSKTTLETPVKEKPLTIDDDVINISGVSVKEIETKDITPSEDIIVSKDDDLENTLSKSSPVKEKENVKDGEDIVDINIATVDAESDIKIKETPIIPAVGEPKMKQKGCLVM